jgi:hypothetical protein
MTSRGEPRAPRSSAQVVRSSLDELRSRRKRRGLRRTILGVALLVLLVWGANQLLVARPVQAALASDPRTAAIGLVGRFDRYVIPTTLVLDLRRTAVTDTNDLLRGVLVVARDLMSLAMVDRVVLARAGTPVYALSGDDFRKVGRDFTIVRNPVVVLRTLTEALRLPGGAKPPPLDFGEAARRWATAGQ